MAMAGERVRSLLEGHRLMAVGSAGNRRVAFGPWLESGAKPSIFAALERVGFSSLLDSLGSLRLSLGSRSFQPRLRWGRATVASSMVPGWV